MRLLIALFLVVIAFLSYCPFIKNDSYHFMLPMNNEVAVGFSLPDMSGNAVSLTEFHGSYVLVHFWALWCSPCIKEFPALQMMYDSLTGKNFEILAVHVGPKEEGLKDFLHKHGIQFPVVIDESMRVKGWDIPALPVSYLVNPDGEIVYKAVGPKEWNDSQMQLIIN